MFSEYTPKIVRFLYNMEKYGRAEQANENNTAMRIGCRIPETTNAHSAYVIPFAFPVQQLLHECTSLLR